MTLPSSIRIYVAAQAVDLRRGFDGLAAATRSRIRPGPLNGHPFAFFNRRRNRIKLLVSDRTAYLRLNKLIERGTFHLPNQPHAAAAPLERDAACRGSATSGLPTAERRPSSGRSRTLLSRSAIHRIHAGSDFRQHSVPGFGGERR